MTTKKSKHQERKELEQKVHDFLLNGGEVKRVPSGTSGCLNNINVFKQSALFEPKPNRTPLTEVIKTLEERKSHKPEKIKLPLRQAPQKKLLIDDFGDPIRWVWENK